MPSARVLAPWREHSTPAASCLQWSCALQAEAVDTFFFFACAHLTRGRCCTSDLIAPTLTARNCTKRTIIPDSVVKNSLVVQEWKELHRDLSLWAEELERDPHQCFRQKHAHAASAGDRPVS